MKYRTEIDSIGEYRINENCTYGIHTARALDNFSLSSKPMSNEVIRAMVLIKRCAANVNLNEGFLDTDKAGAIIQACDNLLDDGISTDEFPLPAIQGGAGTSSHMNVNEVIANRALKILGHSYGDYTVIHPLNDVNKFQSTNDVFPSAAKIAAIRLLHELADELARLQESLQNKETEFADMLKIGRTEMQDAMPITLGQEFGAYSEAIARDRWRVFKCIERLRSLNIGGTAIGTGINAPKIFIFRLIEELRSASGLGINRAENTIDATQNQDAFVEVSGIVKTVAVNFIKISSDLRLMSSGPYGGLAEINLPELQAGSSIMPGKVNPVIPELLNSIGMQVIGHDASITFAASSGQLELNAFIPVIASNLIDAIKLLLDGARIFRTRCILGISANVKHCAETLERSTIMATLLAPYIGYDEAASLVHIAEDKGMSVRQAAIESGYFNEKEMEYIFNSRKATSPGIAGSDRFSDKLDLKITNQLKKEKDKN